MTELDELRKQSTQRGARMQVMRQWLIDFYDDGVFQMSAWDAFLNDHPEAEGWFDERGVPV